MKKVNIAVVCLILALSIVGCGQSQNNRNNTGTQPMNFTKSQSMNGVNSTIDTYDDNKKNTTYHNKNREHQSYLTQHVRSVEGVTDSTILIDDNNNIIVGLDVDNKANRTQVENSVRSMLLKDHNGQNVHVTSDSKFHDRIRTLNQQMTTSTDGQPFKNMANDIKTLLDDIGKSINNTVNNTVNNTMK